MSKVVVRPITARQARSYRRTVPNPIGVTSLVAVNGRGAHARAKAAAAKKKVAKKGRVRRVTTRTTSVVSRVVRVAPNKRGARKRRARGGVFAKNARSRSLLGGAMKKRGRKKAKVARRRKSAARRRGHARVHARRRGGIRRAKAHRRSYRRNAIGDDAFSIFSQRQEAAGVAGYGKKKSKSKKRRGGKHKAKASAHRRRRVIGKRYGRGKRTFKSVAFRAGIRKIPTFLYSRKGKLRHIPAWAEAGGKSAKDAKTSPKVASRIAKIMERRARAGSSVARRGSAFVPNARRRPRTITYHEWAMRPNMSKRKKSKKHKKSAHKRRPRTSLKTRARRGIKAVRTFMKKSKARRHGGVSKKRAGKSLGRVAKYVGNRRRHHRRYHRNEGAVAATPNRRRRHHRRHSFRRNAAAAIGFNSGAFLEDFKGMLSTGIAVLGGFVVHKTLTNLLAPMVTTPALNTGTLGQFKSSIVGAVVGGAELLLMQKFAPRAMSSKLVAGVGVAFLQSFLSSVAVAMGQTKAAGYLAGVDRPGRAYHGYGDYELTGAGEYMPMSGFGAPMLAQAAAGFGAPLAQAAAGFGAPLAQAAAGFGAPLISEAAAGTGEYVAQNLKGIGDYELTGPSAMPLSGTYDGIAPNLYSAEAALTAAEHAAGVGMGDIPDQSTWIPTMQPDAISNRWAGQSAADQPEGARAGVFTNADGIFG